MLARYFFDLIEDDRLIPDDTGLELVSDEQMHEEARRCADWIAAGYRDGRRPASAEVRVRDASGAIVLCLPIEVAPLNE